MEHTKADIADTGSGGRLMFSSALPITRSCVPDVGGTGLVSAGSTRVAGGVAAGGAADGSGRVAATIASGTSCVGPGVLAGQRVPAAGSPPRAVSSCFRT